MYFMGKWGKNGLILAMKTMEHTCLSSGEQEYSYPPLTRKADKEEESSERIRFLLEGKGKGSIQKRY